MKLPKEITLNHITAIISIVGFLFGVTSGVLYMKWTGEHNAQQIEKTNESVEELKETLDDRIKVNNEKSAKQDEKISDISKDLAVVKSQVSDIKDGQGVVIRQLSDLTAAIVRKDISARREARTTPAVYEVQN